MITAVIDAGQHYCQAVSDLWQWDYGQTLRIQGVKLPAAVEIQFSTTERIGETVTRIGVTQEGVTEVPIPDTLLEGGGTTQDYTIYAFVYIENGDSGKTEYRVSMKVRARPKPEAHATPEEGELFRQAIVAVAESADRAESARKSAETAADKAESAKNAAESASGSAQASADEAKTSKENAETAVKNAEAFKTETETAKAEAVQAAADATAAKKSAEEARAAAEKAKQDAEAAKAAADADKEAAEAAQAKAEAAQKAAENAETEAKKTQAATETAKTAVETMQSTVAGYADNANVAKESAETARSEAETAKNDAVQAKEAAEKAKSGTAADREVAEAASKAAQVSAVSAEKSAERAETAKEEIQESADQIQKNATEIDSLKEDLDNMEHIISANNIKNAPVVSKLVDESYAHESNFVIINGMCYMHYMYNTWDKWSDMNIHPETQGYIGVRLSVFSIAEPDKRTVYNIVRGGDDFLGETVKTNFCGSGTITKIGTVVRILTNITLSNSGRTCVFFDFDSTTNSVTKKGICNVRIKGTDDFVPMTIQNGKQHAKWLYDNGYIDTEYESLFNEFGSDIREYSDNGTKYVTTAMANGTNARSCVLLTSEDCINWTALGILDTQTASGIRLNVMEAGAFRYGKQFYLIGRNNVNIATDSKDVPYFWKIEDSNLYKSTKPVCLDGDVDCSGAKPSVIRLISRNNLFLLANISAYDKNEFSLVSGIGRVAIEFYKLNFDKDTMKAKRILRVSMIEGIHTPCLHEYERNVYMSYTSQKRLLHFMDGDIRFCKLDEELFH